MGSGPLSRDRAATSRRIARPAVHALSRSGDPAAAAGRAAESGDGAARAERRRSHARIVDGVFRSIARVLVSFARFPRLTKDNIHEWIRYEGYEHFESALKQGKGVLFATAHLGNWELSAFAHALMSGPMHVVVRPLDNPRIDALVERGARRPATASSARRISRGRSCRRSRITKRWEFWSIRTRGSRTASSSTSSACRPARGRGSRKLRRTRALP